MNKRYFMLFSAMLAASAGIAAAQATAEFYRLDFTLKELEGGKIVNSRNYQMMVKADENSNFTSSIRSGGKVPFGGNYIDVGVNIDVKRVAHITKDELALDVVSEVSGSVEPGDGQVRQSGPPIVRQSRWNSTVLVTLRKPQTIFSSDDATSKRVMQLELTATPIR